jgi:diguanylate cyclase (GGDEF)-like protein
MADREPLIDALLRLTRTLAQERSLDACLKAVTDTALNLVPGDHASIRVLDATRTELLASARSGAGAQARPAHFVKGQGVIGWVVNKGKAVRIDDVERDDRFVPASGQGFAIGAMLAVPLFSAAQVIGVLSISAEEAGTFTEKHLDLARLLAYSAVPPIEYARMRRLAVSDYPSMALAERMLHPHLKVALKHAQENIEPLSLICLDLDHFGRMQEIQGRHVGNRVLRDVARRIRLLSRREDILVRRRGGEFVLILPHADTTLAVEIGERIRRDLERHSIPLRGDATLKQTVSVGVASWDGREPAESLEDRATRAALAAVESGRNVVKASVLVGE